MMDRKRSIVDGDGVFPPAKRHNAVVNVGDNIGGAVGGSSSANKEIKFGPPESPFRYDLDTFQKDTLYRNWQLAKLDKKNADKELEDRRDENIQLKDLIVKLDLALSQLLDEANILTSNLEIQNTITYPSEEDYEEGLDASNPHTFVSALLSKDSEFQSSLIDERFSKVKDLLKNVISRIPNSPPEILQLQSQLARIAAAEKTHIQQYEKLSALLQEEKKKRETLEYRAVIANAKLLKVQSQVCQYMEWQARALSKTEEKTTTNGAPINGTSSSEISAAIHAAEAAKQAALAEVQKRTEQVEALELEKLKLSEELTAANARVHSLTDDDFSNTELFRILKSRYEDVVHKANDLEKLNAEFREETQKLKSERTAFQNEIEKESRERCEELEGQVAKNMAEIQRLRQDRDAKFNEKVVLELSQSKYDTELSDLKRLNEAQLSQIQGMQNQLERLKLQLASESNGPADDVPELSEEAIRKELKKYKGLYSVLEQEVESMNKTVIKFRELAGPRTEQLRKVEQELEAMKMSRAKLQSKSLAQEVSLDAKRQEIQLLKHQVSKTSSVIASINEANSKHADAAAVNERLKEEMRAEVLQLTGQNRDLQQKALEAKMHLNQARTEIGELLEQLKAKESIVSAAEHAMRKAEAEAAGLREELEEQKKWIQGMMKNKGDPTEELDMLRKVAYCSVCNQNVKNTLLKVCSHTLCSKCADLRIQNRQRKCPICMKPFGVGDLLPVHFV